MQPFEQLEREWAEFNELDPAGMVVCSSGTAALHLALEALELPPGSEVLVPDFTMVACARAVTLAGLTPVFVDCDERLLMDAELVFEFPEKEGNCGGYRVELSAVLVVHIYGRLCNMERLHDIKQIYSGEVSIIEDLAEAHGIRPHPATDAACWSFYRNKIIAGEEGGAVWFRNPERAALARQLRSLGFTAAHDFDHIPRGHNYRLANLLAWEVIKSMGCYKMHVAERRQLEMFCEAHCPAEWKMPMRDAPWVYDLRIPGLSRQQQQNMVSELNREGIAARMSFLPMRLQREYSKCRWVPAAPARSGKAANEVLYLPLTPDGSVTPATIAKSFEIIDQLLQTS